MEDQFNLGSAQRYSPCRLRLPLVALVVTLALASSLARTAPAAPAIPHFDKIAHVLVFGLMGTLAFRASSIGFLEVRRAARAMLLVLAYGAFDEILQYFNPHRSFEPADWLADIGGACLAIILYRNWRWYRALLERPLWRRAN